MVRSYQCTLQLNSKPNHHAFVVIVKEVVVIGPFPRESSTLITTLDNLGKTFKVYAPNHNNCIPNHHAFVDIAKEVVVIRPFL